VPGSHPGADQRHRRVGENLITLADIVTAFRRGPPASRAFLEREVEQAKDERDFLREQIDRKDRTIDSLLERDRETNFLIRGLQELIPRLGIGRTPPPEPQQPDVK